MKSEDLNELQKLIGEWYDQQLAVITGEKGVVNKNIDRLVRCPGDAGCTACLACWRRYPHGHDGLTGMNCQKICNIPCVPCGFRAPKTFNYNTGECDEGSNS